MLSFLREWTETVNQLHSMKIFGGIINRVDRFVDSILLCLLIYLLSVYSKRESNMPNAWASVEQVNKRNIMSVIQTLKHKKKLINERKEVGDEKQ